MRYRYFLANIATFSRYRYFLLRYRYFLLHYHYFLLRYRYFFQFKAIDLARRYTRKDVRRNYATK